MKTCSTVPFALIKTHDSLYHLRTASSTSRRDWLALPYPVYRFCVGDIDGDGSDDALVGVIKKTRFHRENARRIFLFKQVNGKPRPLWMGSKLGGVLQDFRYHDGRVVSLEASPPTEAGDTLYSVAEWRWKGFGLQFLRFRIHLTDKKTAIKYLEL